MRVLPWILLSVLASGAGQLLLKAGASESGEALARSSIDLAGWLRLLASWRVLLGLALWTASTLLYLVVLSRTQLSFAYCVAGLNYIVVPLAARAVFAESMSGTRLAGVAVIAVGVALTLYGRALEPGGG